MSSNNTKLFIFKNHDKDSWQKEPDAQTGTGFRRGSRCLLVGNPNSGKTCAVLNKITDSTPPYDLVYVYQASIGSCEYKDIDYIQLKSIQDLPKQEDIPRDKKILIILEDMDTIDKKDLLILDVYFRFSASHLGVCIVIVAQNFYSVPVSLRRKMDCFILFLDGADFSILHGLPIPKEDKIGIANYFRRHGNRYSFITIDLGIKDRYIFNNEIVLTF